MAPLPIRVSPKPGIQRDGTRFDSEAYVDGLWTRFYRARPKKIGGYQSITTGIPGLPYTMASYTAQNNTFMHLGPVDSVLQVVLNSAGVYTGLNDRTPTGLAADPDRLWQFEVMYDSAGGANYLIAHGPPNLNDISNEIETEIYYGGVQGSGLLIDTTVANESGGIAAVAPYLFKFGNNGHIAWSVPNDPADFSGTGAGEAWVTPSKIIRGLPLRSGGQGPAALFWSLNALIRGNFVGSTNGYWAFDSLATGISVLSTRSIIEVEGTYYWLGVDRGLMFNGVVREIPNTYNIDWLLNNINMSQRQKVFAFRVPRWGEIWWCVPFGNATEPTHAIIYNYREGYWYDTELPEGGRSVGLYADVLNRPFMVGVEDDSGYTLWQHETGVDAIRNSSVDPVTAHFTTNEMTLIGTDDPKNKSLRISRMEPDFIQQGSLLLTVKGRANARSTIIDSDARVITESAANVAEQLVDLKETRRLMSLKFESNTVGGNFYMGKTIAHIEESDGRETQ